MTSQTVIYNKLNYFLRRVWAFAMTTGLFPQTIQIMVGIMNLGFGILSTAIGDLGLAPFWLGGMVRVVIFHENVIVLFRLL